MRCLRSSVSSRVRRASSACALAWGEAELGALSDALLRFRFVALRLRALARSPLALERCFIGSPVGSGSILSGLGRTPEVALARSTDGVTARATIFYG
jgi:hypothetical protein